MVRRLICCGSGKESTAGKQLDGADCCGSSMKKSTDLTGAAARLFLLVAMDFDEKGRRMSSTAQNKKGLPMSERRPPSPIQEFGPVWRRQKISTSVDADDFKRLGAQIMDRVPDIGSELVSETRWTQMFKTTKHVATIAWGMIMKHFGDDAHLQGSRPEHLLWAFMQLNKSAKPSMLAKAAGCDEKTFRKWAWRFIYYISYLLDEVVRCESTNLLVLSW